MSDLKICPMCQVRVCPMEDGRCPACKNRVFAESDDAHVEAGVVTSPVAVSMQIQPDRSPATTPSQTNADVSSIVKLSNWCWKCAGCCLLVWLLIFHNVAKHPFERGAAELEKLSPLCLVCAAVSFVLAIVLTIWGSNKCR
jgi:hypothetical protein